MAGRGVVLEGVAGGPRQLCSAAEALSSMLRMRDVPRPFCRIPSLEMPIEGSGAH